MNTQCSTGAKCGMKPWLISTVVAFLFTMGFDWYVHGSLLMDMYKATESMWRPLEEMQALYAYCWAKHFILAAIFACLYGCWRAKTTMGAFGSRDCAYRKSMGFGLWIGLMLGVNTASSYIYMPIPKELALAWLASEAVKWTLTGAVLSLLAGSCKSKAA